MSDVSGWIESVQSLLMFGLTDENLEEEKVVGGHNNDPQFQEMEDVRTLIDSLLVQARGFENQSGTLRLRIETLLSTVNEQYKYADSTVCMAKVEKYIKLKLKIQHMCLIKAMYQLQKYRSPKDIPALIFAVRDDVPGVLLGHSRIKAVVLETVSTVKAPLLAKFHQLLDDHLVAAQKETTPGSQDAGQQWAAFLMEAKDTLLAFTMVNMLPTVLTETSGMILEKFQDTLDVALTPTWGRYHSHLQLARTARSSQQIMWTFDYTRSFVRMVCDLATALTASQELQRLCPLDYASAGQKQVLDKAVKFMRAHLAQIVVDYSPLSRELCMQLAEETLELDEWIHSTAAGNHSQHGSSGRDKKESVISKMAPLTVCEVLFDAKEVFHQWLHLEHRYFYFELRGRFRDAAKVFCFEFGDNSGETSEMVAVPALGNTLRMTKLRCFKGVYDCMCLFFAACERYQHLPSPAQRILSVCILEPLLCTALGLLLYRTRSSAVLYQISMGTYRRPAPVSKRTSSSSDGAYSGDTAGGLSEAEPAATQMQPRELVEFTDTACYLQSCLAASARRNLASRSAAQFKSVLWSELQSWMPQILISEEDAKKGFSAVDLVDKAWKLPAEYSAEGDYAYRNPLPTGSGKGGMGSALRTGGKTGVSVHSAEVCEIGECVDVARGLAITLCNVLRQQLSICK